MSKSYGRVLGLKDDPEPDGSHIIIVRDFDGKPFEAILSPEEIKSVIMQLQHSLARSGQASQYDSAQILGSTLVYGQAGAVGVQVSTHEGEMVLHGEPAALRRLGVEIDRALSFLEQPRN